MKRIVILLAAVLIPLFLMAGHSPMFKHSAGRIDDLRLDRAWRLGEELKENYDGSAWVNNENFVNNYNPDYPNRIDGSDVYSWDSDNSEWVNTMHVAHTYFPGHEYIGFTEISYVIPGIGNTPMMRAYYGYDTQNRLYMAVRTMYDMDLNTWRMMYRMNITYGTGTTFNVCEWYAADDPDPAYWFRMNFTFDAQGRIVNELRQNSPDSLNWVDEEQTSYVYHPHDNMTGASFISYVAHNLPLLMLQDEGGPEYGMIASDITQQWTGTTWVDDYQEIYTYNDQDKLTQIISQSWDTSWRDWINDEQTTFSYDTNGNTHQITNAWWDDFGQIWHPEDRKTDTWEQYTAGQDETSPAPEQLVLSIYPNPFKNRLTSSVQTKSHQPVHYSLYNSKGQLLESKTALPNQPVSWQPETRHGAGIYLLKAEQDGQSVTRKVMQVH